MPECKYLITIYLNRPLVISCVLFVASTLCISFVDNIYLFAVLFVLAFGFGKSLGYVPPIAVSWKHFPSKRGVIAGTILCGYGMAAFIFDLIATAIVNPNNIQPKEIYVGKIKDHYFEKEVYENVNS
jgi:MFS family permease